MEEMKKEERRERKRRMRSYFQRLVRSRDRIDPSEALFFELERTQTGSSPTTLKLVRTTLKRKRSSQVVRGKEKSTEIFQGRELKDKDGFKAEFRREIKCNVQYSVLSRYRVEGKDLKLGRVADSSQEEFAGRRGRKRTKET